MALLKQTTRHAAALRITATVAIAIALSSASYVIASKVQYTKADKIKTEALGGQDRYLTHLSTDKPIYRIGESVYIRAVLLHALNRKPMLDKSIGCQLEIKGPKGDIVSSSWGQLEDGVAGLKWEVPQGQPGGQYTIKISWPGYNAGFSPAERTFDIRAYRAPRLKTQIIFLRDGYGPGDTVTASCSVERAEGGVPENAEITVVARLDGEEVHRAGSTMDIEGNCGARFKLPESIATGDGVLMFIIKDGGTVETATKTIPILLSHVDLKIYPEGGDLAAGLANRVYIEARTPNDKPADIAGVVVDELGNTVSRFATAHEGRGRFDIKPDAAKTYTLRITQPSGIKSEYTLPKAIPNRAVLQASENITKMKQPLRLKVGSGIDRKVSVTLSKRETEIAVQTVELLAGQMADIVFSSLPDTADGVLIATIWDDKDQPLAERLVYREPVDSINVALSVDKDNPTPGDTIKVTLKTTNSSGKPVEAVVGVTVSDDTVREMIETREQAPRLPVMVLLEDEVRELADATVYLDDKNPNAPQYLDLLLGTQGWRRFAYLRWAEFLKESGDDARRLMALRIVTRAEVLKRGDGRERFLGAEKADGAFPPPMPMAAGVPEGAMPEEAPEALGDDEPVNALAKEEQAADKKPMGEREQMAAILDADAEAEAKKIIAVDMIAPRRQMAMAAVRIYAHPRRANWSPNERIDFAETLFWAAGIRTNSETGEASFTFALNDSVTTFNVTADAYSLDGVLGWNEIEIQSVRPFYIEPKLPLEVTAGDRVLVSVAVVNNIGSLLAGECVASLGDREMSRTEIIAEEYTRGMQIIELQFDEKTGVIPFVLETTAGIYSDRVVRELNVVPSGFPVKAEFGGLLGPDKPASFEIIVPNEVVANSVSTESAVYPSPIANLTDALEALIRDPYGCFEQTSSTTYPLVMAMQYFVSHTGIDPMLIQRSREKLDAGYKRLIGFECKANGYEWFGSGDGHEALTAYGLMQFMEMKDVLDGVDKAMIERTKKWLMDRRDNKGGFMRNPQALDDFGGAPEDTTNAYIVWALVESGADGMEKEIENLKAIAEKTSDTYVIAMAANVLSIKGDKDGARKLMKRLADKQADNGHVPESTTTITVSRGESQDIETTSAALLAWMRDETFAGNIEKGMKFLVETCKSGRFGSTQGTIMALKAIVQYDKLRSKPKAPGSVELYVDGELVESAIAFNEETKGAIKLPDFTSKLTPGKHTVSLKMIDGAEMPFSLTAAMHTTLPVASKDCRLTLDVRLTNATVTAGDGAEMIVTVKNVSDKVAPTPIAIIGLPGGLEPRHDQLKELVKSGRIDAYEVIGREVVCYWRHLPAGATATFPISCVAEVAGEYTGPASRAYEYYANEFKVWVAGKTITINPR